MIMLAESDRRVDHSVKLGYHLLHLFELIEPKVSPPNRYRTICDHGAITNDGSFLSLGIATLTIAGEA